MTARTPTTCRSHDHTPTTWRILKKHKFIAIIGVLAIGSAFYFGYRNIQSNGVSEEQVETATARRGDIKINVTGSGQVFSEGQVDIRPQVAGDGLDVIEVAVKNDQEVKKGDLIAVLDTKDAQEAIRDAELDLRSLQIKMKQTEKQYDTMTIEDKWARQLQEITMQQNSNRLADAREELDDYYIKAPFDGIVTGLSVEAGDSVARDEILASVITKKMYAEISLNEVDAVQVKVGSQAILEFDAFDGVSAAGEVTKIDTIGQVSSGVVSYNAKISFDVPDERLKPGMSVSAEVLINSAQDVLLVPSTAVEVSGQKHYALVLTDPSTNQISSEPVEVGLSDDINTEIISGLKEGDVVVTKMPINATGANKASFNSEENNNGSAGFFNIGGGASKGGRK